MTRRNHPRRYLLRRVVLLAAVCGLVAAHALAKGALSPDAVEGPIVWGEATRVTHLSHLYFADQPDVAGFEAAKKAGVTTVIDLRAPAERDWDERAVVEGMGLTYYNAPVTGDAFDPAVFRQIEAWVAEHPDDEILIHCSSSNRVGAWLAVHLVEKHGLAEEEAIEIGRRAGITQEAMELKVRAYLAQPSE